jgi:hypothetical protein
MIRTVFSVLVLGSLTVASTLKAEPSRTPNRSNSNASKKEAKLTAATTANSAVAPAKWSLVNGVWVHPDGYKFVSGQVVRTGAQTHKTPPKPPTRAEMDAATKQSSPKTPADLAASKAAEKERNLRPRPAPQTGSHL